MPTHKGVRISIISQSELSIHPEFAHPDSSQFKRSPGLIQRESLPPAPAFTSESKADQLLGRKSAVSVYIPSMSGTRFWLRYDVLEPEKTVCRLWYFKLFMNGRNIISWGINTKTMSSGQVMRALFDPSGRWNYKENGILFKNNGTEARPFFFSTVEEARSAASDGGLIEVLVFRARGRKRRFAEPEEFRNQEKYGISMPTGGLLDKTQEAKYYDYLLIDPKDNPYATFRFHYRSWDHLESLQLIPSDHPRILLPATLSLLSLNGQSRELQEEQDWETIADVLSPSKLSPSSIKSSPSHTPWLTDIFDDSHKLAEVEAEKELSSPIPPESSPTSEEEPKLRLPVSVLFEAGHDRPLSQMHAKNWIECLGRPLPEIPTRTSLKEPRASFSPASITHSRKSSATSHAPSVAPSLRAYADRDSSSSPEPVIGVVAAVPVLKSGFGDGPYTGGSPFFSSPEPDSDPFTESSPAQPNTSENRRAIVSPREGLVLAPNVTIRKHRRAPNTSLSPSKSIPLHDDDNNTTLSLTESEWMCRTPSPVRDNPSNVRLSKLWSSGVDRYKSPIGGSTLREKTMDWCNEVESPERDPVAVSPLAGVRLYNDKEVNIRSGNWI